MSNTYTGKSSLNDFTTELCYSTASHPLADLLHEKRALQKPLLADIKKYWEATAGISVLSLGVDGHNSLKLVPSIDLNVLTSELSNLPECEIPLYHWRIKSLLLSLTGQYDMAQPIRCVSVYPGGLVVCTGVNSGYSNHTWAYIEATAGSYNKTDPTSRSIVLKAKDELDGIKGLNTTCTFNDNPDWNTEYIPGYSKFAQSSLVKHFAKTLQVLHENQENPAAAFDGCFANFQ